MFITIDGPDGTGKTTLSKELVQRLNQLDIPAVYTSEPTNSPLGKRIRQILRDGGADAGRLTELFVQDRKEHIEDFIAPKTNEGQIVICDRYKYSTICYQHLQGEPIERLLSLNRPFPSPDIAFILNVDSPDILLGRIEKRGLETEIFEKRPVILQTIALYRQMSSFYPNDQIIPIDANNSLKTISDTMIQHILSRNSIHSEHTAVCSSLPGSLRAVQFA